MKTRPGPKAEKMKMNPLEKQQGKRKSMINESSREAETGWNAKMYCFSAIQKEDKKSCGLGGETKGEKQALAGRGGGTTYVEIISQETAIQL